MELKEDPKELTLSSHLIPSDLSFVAGCFTCLVVQVAAGAQIHRLIVLIIATDAAACIGAPVPVQVCGLASRCQLGLKLILMRVPRVSFLTVRVRSYFLIAASLLAASNGLAVLACDRNRVARDSCWLVVMLMAQMSLVLNAQNSVNRIVGLLLVQGEVLLWLMMVVWMLLLLLGLLIVV